MRVSKEQLGRILSLGYGSLDLSNVRLSGKLHDLPSEVVKSLLPGHSKENRHKGAMLVCFPRPLGSQTNPVILEILKWLPTSGDPAMTGDQLKVLPPENNCQEKL